MSAEQQESPSAPGSSGPANDTEPQLAAADALGQADGGGHDDGGHDRPDAEDDEQHGAHGVADDVLVNANLLAAQARALDAASAKFGLQTNQQINFNGVTRTQVAYQTTQLSAETLRRVRASFVSPGGYTALRHLLLKANLVVLSGRPGSGREHLAVHILDALCDGTVDHLTGGALTDLDTDTLDDDTGFLWTDIAEGVAGTVEAAHAERLIETLRVRRACMVIVWPESARWPFELEHHSYKLDQPVDLAAVLRWHLQPDADELEPAAVELLGDPDVAEALVRLDGAGEAAGLGQALREVLLGRGSVHEALRKSQGTADWFVRLPEREDRAFALSLAALDELSFPTVAAGARRMDELIQQAEDPKGRSFIRVLERPARQLLATVNAVRVPKLLSTSYGDVPIVAVKSNRKEFSKEMVRALWQDIPYLHEPYLQWLAELVESPDPEVRARAAMVAGLLAKDDFGFVRNRILGEWAGNSNREVRRAAAVALRAPALSADLKDIVWKLLDEWAADDGAVRSQAYFRRLTAAVALGGPVGATDYGRALEIITQRLLDWKPGRYPYRIWGETMTAVTDLFGDGGSAQSTAVLEQLVEWAEDGRVGQRQVAIGTLVAVVARPPIQGYQDDSPLPPALRAVAADPKNLDRLAGLWRLAINDRVMAETSISALLRIAGHVQASGGEELLCDLVRRLPDTARERRTLRFAVRQWIEPATHPRILERLLDLLKSLEVTR